LQGDDAVAQNMFNGLKIPEDVIAETVFSQCFPHVFGRIEFRAVGRQEDQAHVVGHPQFVGHMPACLIHDPEDEFVAVSSSDFGQED
jgi:hypothetical protein